MAAMHCNREEFVSIAKPDCRFSHTLAVYLLRGLLFTKTLRLFVNRLLFHHVSERRRGPAAKAACPGLLELGEHISSVELVTIRP